MIHTSYTTRGNLIQLGIKIKKALEIYIHTHKKDESCKMTRKNFRQLNAFGNHS